MRPKQMFRRFELQIFPSFRATRAMGRLFGGVARPARRTRDARTHTRTHTELRAARL